MPEVQPDGYLAVPPSGQGNPVLVLHPWWGLNATIRAYCDRLAAAGFTVLAPDLYHGKIVDTLADAEAMVNALDGTQAKADIAAAVTFLDERTGNAGSLAVVGFSLGAFFALDLAATHPTVVNALVIYYGTGPSDFGASHAAFLGHFAEEDPFEPRDAVDALEAMLRQAGRPVTFHHYPGTGHWFAEADRTDAYDPAAAELAWERTLAFLLAR